MSKKRKIKEKTVQSNEDERVIRLDIRGKDGEVTDLSLLQFQNGDFYHKDEWDDDEIALVRKFAKAAAKLAKAIHPVLITDMIIEEVNEP
jgi:hypothetical protein